MELQVTEEIFLRCRLWTSKNSSRNVMNPIVRRYRAEDEGAWNDFIAKAKNATFLFDRKFMNYHADRFRDHSLMIFDDRGLKAVIPANELGNSLVSHGGLSYGGMILEETVRLEDVLRFFFHALQYLHANGFNTLIYKCVPANYAKLPSFEDQYVMFLLEARLVKRDMSAVCVKSHGLRPHDTRRSTIKKNALYGHKIVRTNDPSLFWGILQNNLMERHGVAPVHKLQEIQLLMKMFPDEIHCFEVSNNDDILGGTLIFETATTAHTQYIASTPEGKKTGALDVLFFQLMSETFSHKEFFSFGTSNERDGKLKPGLNFWKEGFGARSLPIDTYEVNSASYKQLEQYG